MHLATLGEALVLVWAEPFKNYTRKYHRREPYLSSRDAFGEELEQLCEDMKRNLKYGQPPVDKLRQAARTLAS